MTTIGVLGDSRLFPKDLERAVSGDRVVRFERVEALDDAEEVEVAIGSNQGHQILKAFLVRAPKLRWLHIASAGVNLALSSEVLARPDLTVTNSRGSYDVPVSEFVLALMLSVSKHLPEYQRAQEGSRWDRSLTNTDMRGATVVVLGLGSIGAEVARLASAFGMRVIGIRRRLNLPTVPSVSVVVGPDQLMDVVGDADFVAITAPLTAATRGLVSREVLARMKPTSWIVNVSRGEIVDESALREALGSRLIGGAAIDTWWTEPLDSTSPWWRLPNVIATPHAASSSPLTRQRTLDLFLENLRRWRGGEPLLNVVDPTVGY